METNFSNFNNKLNSKLFNSGGFYIGDPDKPNVWKDVEFNDGDKVKVKGEVMQFFIY